MSAIALKWVSEIRVGNQTAKQLLSFLASHSFHTPGMFFKIRTLSDQLEVSERTIHKAINILIDKKLITKENRYHSVSGCQLNNGYYLNIPQQYVHNYFENEANPHSRWGERRADPILDGVNVVQGEGERGAPLYNNNINNNKKRESNNTSQAKPPSIFEPDQENQKLCSEYGLELKSEIESFMNRHKGKKTQYEFKRWLDNGKEYLKTKKETKEPVRSIPWADEVIIKAKANTAPVSPLLAYHLEKQLEAFA